MTNLPHAFGGPPLRGVLRSTPEDFFVDEDLGFAPDGAGEHVFVRVEKRGSNTDWVGRELAHRAGIPVHAVSHAGLKDRYAVARQTFSLHLPGKADPDWTALAHAEFRVIESARHNRKLQRGALKGNFFRIVVRGIEGERESADKIVEEIRAHGVPNYFGEQRFGRESANLGKARAMFAGRRVQRHERSLLLSAARSHLFNAVLAARVERGEWNTPLDGDVFMLAGSHSIFGPEPLTPKLLARHVAGDIAPTGPMWGAGELRTRDAVAELEHSVARQFPELAAGLVANGLRQARRSLVLRPSELTIRWLPDAGAELSFNLSSGSYATVLLREIFDYRSAN
ncbi:MAG: tRNA pseudouridine(13) synthase TruD [Rudaea sp.]|uniref:tRNA pseudouridine(13) synthase TruD n=1 Tax=Rudaea sp. TaxID=2136325 RepID=UPI0039E66F0A